MKGPAMAAKPSELPPKLHHAAAQYQSASRPDNRWLASYLRNLKARIRERGLSHTGPDGRSHVPTASPALLAQTCAVLDLIVADGISEKAAAEILIQHLILSGVRLPEFRGGRKNAMGLLDWRVRLLTTKTPDHAWSEYETFTRMFGRLPSPSAINALDQRLWNRRAAEFAVARRSVK
jgi:hypothetical protein